MHKLSYRITETERITHREITVYSFFRFDDDVTMRVYGGLVCSQHGRRHCGHHKLAHAAILELAASSEAATVQGPDFEAWLDATFNDFPNPLPEDLGIEQAECDEGDDPDDLQPLDYWNDEQSMMWAEAAS